MAAIAQMQNALRAEIRDLKVKIVSLETAEADNARLRQKLSSIKNTENIARLEEYKSEATCARDSKTAHGSSEAMELEHQREIAKIIDRNRDEVDVLQNQLRVVQTKRDELTRKLEEASVELELKDRKLESLGVDGSLDSNNSTSDRMLSAEYLSLQLKLREANEEIKRLKAGTTKQTGMTAQIDSQGTKKVEKLERENLKLHDALKKGEHDRKKHDITVLQLERRNHDLKMCLQKMEIQGQSADADTRASYGFIDDEDLEIKCQRLQTELRKTKNALNEANLKREELSYELRKASTANMYFSPEVDMLQQRNESLHLSCEKLGGEVENLKKQLLNSGDRNKSLIEEIIDVKNLLQSSEEDKKKINEQLARYEMQIAQQRDGGVDAPLDQPSNMIRQMKQNLKLEKANTVKITANFREQLGSGAQTTEEDATREILTKLREENRKLNLDVNQLQRKLEDERQLSRSLRTENGELAATNYSSGNKLLLRGGGPSFSPASPSKTLASTRTTKPTSASSTRGSVKGIAARFENGGLQIQSEDSCTSFIKKGTDRPTSRTSFSKRLTEPSDEVKCLKRDLDIERKQLVEVEEELTRQCEINSSLLKDIHDLSLEIETQRRERSKHFKISLHQRKKDQEEIARLSEELTAIAKEKADTGSKCLESKEKIITLQDQVSEKANDFDRTHSRDKETIHRLQDKIQSLEKDLANTLILVEDLRDKLNFEAERHTSKQHTDAQNMKKALDEKETKITQMESEKEKIVLSMKDMTGLRKQEIEELQIELTRMKSKSAEQVREMKLLRDKLEQRNCNLQRVSERDENSTAHWKAENSELRQKLIEATSERQSAEAKLKQYSNDRGGSSKSVQILRERNAALKFEVEKLTRKLSKLNSSDKMQVTRVMI